MKFFKKPLCIILGTIIVTAVVMRLYYDITDDFNLYNMSGEVPFHQEWELAEPSSQDLKAVEGILAQPYTYLGKGAQTYVFKSADDLYVLKFFKFKHLRVPKWIEFLPDLAYIKEYKAKVRNKKERKLSEIADAYKLAYEVDRDNSGLVFLQLNIDHNPIREVTIYDKLGWKHLLHLEHVPFVLQKKGITLRVVLEDLLHSGDLAAVKHRLDQVLELYIQEYARGIYDHDHGVMRNMGFIGDHPLHLDVGKLMKNDQIHQKDAAEADLILISNEIHEWFLEKHPHIAAEMDEYVHQKIHDLLSSHDSTH